VRMLHLQELFKGISQAYIPHQRDPLHAVEYLAQPLFLYDLLQKDEGGHCKR